MLGFTLFVSIILGFFLLLRWMRRREIEAFRDADLSVFEDFKATENYDTPARLREAEPADIRTSQLVDSALKNIPQDKSVQIALFQLKEKVFDEVHRHFYENLESVIGGRYRIFVDVPLMDFVRLKEGKDGDGQLKGKNISYLICGRDQLDVFCGIQLKGAGQTFSQYADYLDSLFVQLGRPILHFPLVNHVSVDEIEEQLAPLMHPVESVKQCDLCGKAMAIRKAVKGKNAGKRYWVCDGFPGCNSIVRIGN